MSCLGRWRGGLVGEEPHIESREALEDDAPAKEPILVIRDISMRLP